LISFHQPLELWRLSRRLGLGIPSTMNLYRLYYCARRPALRKLAPDSLVLDLPRWGKVNLRTNGHDLNLLHQIFVREDYRLDVPEQPVHRVLDLGANIGMATLYLAKLFPEAEFACVEPSPQNLSLLRRTLEMNQLRARVFEAAAGSEPGEIQLYLSSQPDCNSIYASAQASGSIQVPLLTVPEIMRQMGWDSIDLLKIDIEGAERLVLGENNSWLARVRIITGESHVNVGYPYAQVEKDLASFGFVLESLIPETADYGASFRGANSRFTGTGQTPAATLK